MKGLERYGNGWELNLIKLPENKCNFCFANISLLYYFEPKTELFLCRNCALGMKVDKLLRKRLKLRDYEQLTIFHITKITMGGN